MDPAAISDQVNRILRSQTFASKPQLRRLLDMLHRSIDSEPSLKPEDVIRELWPHETRTKRSADVATEMNRLRHALESFYGSEGQNDHVLIVLPNRSSAASDGVQEKRWIVAVPRTGDEGPATRPQTIFRRNIRRCLTLAALGALLGVVAYASFRALTVQGKPRFGRMDGATLAIMDAKGKELWRRNFPEGFSSDWYYGDGVASRIWFGDLDGRGHTDVLFLYLPATSPQSHSSTLICYSERGIEKWRWTPGRDLLELQGSPATYKTFALRVLNATGKEPRRIVVSSGHDPWWPNQIAIVDSHGKTISEYWHSGHLESLELADLDGDGKQEIVAAGINNGYHQATLIVLDPDRSFGASDEPERPELQIHGMGAAKERLRLLFPRSDLNKALFSFNQATELTVEHGNIRLAVRECIIPPGCFVWYELDRNIRLVTAYAGDEFRNSHARFYRDGKDAHTLTPAEEAEFRKVRCLVGCKTEFVPVDIH